ncbi:Mce-associated membrane protein [Actinopolymorpha cephalotaxi]|nr:Mce-associated membrane protein [Actinopolymorpha cephalotaxi]
MTNVLDETPDEAADTRHTVHPAHPGHDGPAEGSRTDDGPARPRSPGPALAVLAALLLAGLVAAGFLGHRVLAARQEDRSRAQALHTARQLVADFTTVDYRKFDRQSGEVLNLAAGDFHSQYSHASKQLRTLVTQNRTVSRGQILEAGITSLDQDSARVLVVADAEVTHVGADRPELRTYRLQLDLSREKAGWRVVELQFVG